MRRVAELGAELADAYGGREPLLVAPLKSSAVFLSDLSRALPVPHGIDFLELAAYASGNSGAVKLLKDLDTSVVDRHVVVVEDVVDTGLTLNFLARTLALREPASLSAVTLLDRPARAFRGAHQRQPGRSDGLPVAVPRRRPRSFKQCRRTRRHSEGVVPPLPTAHGRSLVGGRVRF